jgi:hypothetical protein
MLKSMAIQYTIYVHCRKIYNLFVQAFDTGGKATLWRNFLVYIVFILQFQKSKTTAKLLENSRNKRGSNRVHWRHL